MNADQTECFYCTGGQKIDALMIKICDLKVSTLYLSKNQIYEGKCTLAFNKHIEELFMMDDELQELFIKDVSRATAAIYKVFCPDKMNYVIQGDQVPHLHMHLVPKYKGTEGWEKTFGAVVGVKLLVEEDYQKIISLILKSL